MSGVLPQGFETLEPFAAHWAGATAAQRAHLRSAHPAAERDAFHAACSPLIKHGLERLDAKSLAQLDAGERTLLDMFLTFAHVSLAVDVQARDEDKHQPLRQAMRITRAPLEAGNPGAN